MKLHVFEGLGALFGTFFINFLSFFLNVPPISPTTPEGERAKRARLTRDADSRCTLAGGPQPLLLFVARSVPKPLKVPSLARSVQKPLKVPSLARSVPKPLLIVMTSLVGTSLFQLYSLPTSYLLPDSPQGWL